MRNANSPATSRSTLASPQQVSVPVKASRQARLQPSQPAYFPDWTAWQPVLLFVISFVVT